MSLSVSELPRWATPDSFQRVRGDSFLVVSTLRGVRRATFIYKEKRTTLPIGEAMPWDAIRAHLEAIENPPVEKVPKPSRKMKAASRRYRALVTYEYLYAKLDLARRRALKRGRPFSLTVADLYALGDRQRWRCAVTALRFDCTNHEAWNNPYALAVDRIDNSGGYTVGNVRLVLHAINVALGPWGEDVLAEVARAFLNKRTRDRRRGPGRVPDPVNIART